MIPEITIKISFASAPNGGVEPAVTALSIAPPVVPMASPAEDVPPPPQVTEEPSSSFAFEVPPPPQVMAVGSDVSAVPPVPGSEAVGQETSEGEVPPPAPADADRRPRKK